MRSKIVLFFLFFGTICYAQKAKYTVTPLKSKMFLNCHPTSLARVDLRVETNVLVGVKEGYVTKGITSKDMKASDETQVLQLEKVKHYPSDFKNRKVKFAGLNDKKGLLTQGSYYSTNVLKGDEYISKVNELLEEENVRIVNEDAVFKTQVEYPEILIAGRVLSFHKDTRGPAFQACVQIEWSVLDVRLDQVIYNTTTFGYSDTRAKFKDEVILSIENAVIGLLNESEFEKSIQEGNEVQANDKEVIKLDKLENDKPDSYSDLIKGSIKSVITIKTEHGHGSGFFIDKNGLIVTNYHVVANSDKIEVIFEGGFSFTATVLRTNPHIDVALLKMDGNQFSPLPLSLVDDFDIGTEVIAIGTPQSIELGQTVTKGIISGKREFDDIKLLQTDVAVNSGNSGGPLIDTSTGEVIGMVSSKIIGKGIEGLNFAIPINEIMKSLNLSY